jgi:hypothetical protein
MMSHFSWTPWISLTHTYRRTLKFFTLGVSLGPILDVTNQVDYVKALHLLLHEFDCHNNDHQRPKMASVFVWSCSLCVAFSNFVNCL